MKHVLVFWTSIIDLSHCILIFRTVIWYVFDKTIKCKRNINLFTLIYILYILIYIWIVTNLLLFFVIVVWRCTTGYFTSGKQHISRTYEISLAHILQRCIRILSVSNLKTLESYLIRYIFCWNKSIQLSYCNSNHIYSTTYNFKEHGSYGWNISEERLCSEIYTIREPINSYLRKSKKFTTALLIHRSRL